MSIESSIPCYHIEVFRAVTRPEAALEFHTQHNKVLSSKKIEGLHSGKPSWLENPGVFLFAVYSGKTMVAGLRMHVENNNTSFPFLKALATCGIDFSKILKQEKELVQAEGCGLWVSKEASGYAMVDVLNRVTTACAHKIGVDKFYAICPRHTLDAFKKVGFYHGTIDDKLIQFDYPSKDFQSFMIHCNMADLSLAFRSDKKVIQKIIADPKSTTTGKGNMGECIIQLNGFPIKHLSELPELGLSGKLEAKKARAQQRY